MKKILPDAFYDDPMLKERTLSFYTDSKWKKEAAKNKDENEKRKLQMTHGKKKVGKDWKKFRDDIKSRDTAKSKRDPKKGVKALSKGKWGYVKDGKFKADK
tara:strand:- start:879 stop:1181 length:303 start_codon:yes stop_codon:yes gene_type:complete